MYQEDGTFINVLLFSETTIKADGFDINAFANTMRSEFGRRCDVEIFEHAGTKGEAHNEAVKRSGERLRQGPRDLATLRDWAIGMMILAQGETAVIGTKDVAPLPAIAVADALNQVAKHPAYRKQRVIVTSQDGKMLTLADGKVTVDLFGGKS
jgi:hypothetical protein